MWIVVSVVGRKEVVMEIGRIGVRRVAAGAELKVVWLGATADGAV